MFWWNKSSGASRREWKDMHGIAEPQDVDRWQALENVVMTFWVPLNERNFLTR